MLKGKHHLPHQPLLMSFQYERAFALPVLPVDLLPVAHVCNVYWCLKSIPIYEEMDGLYKYSTIHHIHSPYVLQFGMSVSTGK